MLCRPQLPAALRDAEAEIAGPCPLKAPELGSLYEHFRALEDTRGGHGLHHRTASTLAFAAVANGLYNLLLFQKKIQSLSLPSWRRNRSNSQALKHVLREKDFPHIRCHELKLPLTFIPSAPLSYRRAPVAPLHAPGTLALTDTLELLPNSRRIPIHRKNR